MVEPKDKSLYDSVKRRIYQKMPKHSAYRSAHLVRAYKKAFVKKHGKTKAPYTKGPRPLKRWFLERWRNQSGGVGYRKKSDVYRPTRRVSKKTPKTFQELTAAQIRRARAEKRKTGRVKKF